MCCCCCCCFFPRNKLFNETNTGKNIYIYVYYYLVAEVQQNILWLKVHYNRIKQPITPIAVELPSPVPSDDKDYENHDVTDADAKQRSLDLFENINRLTGITGFKVKAPNPDEPSISSSNAYMLGIRFDVSVAGQYSIPHYIIIRQKPAYKPTPAAPAKGGTTTIAFDDEIEILEQHDLKDLEIFQHTIPAFLPVMDLAHEYLNTNLRRFAMRVRACLVAHALRQHVFAHQLSAQPPTSSLLHRMVKVLDYNQEYTRLRLSARLRRKRAGSNQENEPPREIQIDCVDDQVVTAKLVSTTGSSGNWPAESRDLPLLEAFQGSVGKLTARLLAYYGVSSVSGVAPTSEPNM